MTSWLRFTVKLVWLVFLVSVTHAFQWEYSQRTNSSSSNRPSFAAANQVVTLTRVTNERVMQLSRLVALQFMCCELAFRVRYGAVARGWGKCECRHSLTERVGGRQYRRRCRHAAAAAQFTSTASSVGCRLHSSPIDGAFVVRRLIYRLVARWVVCCPE